MRVRLTRKFANRINGIDLSNAKAGEMLDLPADAANMLMAEGWAEYEGGTPAVDKADEQGRPSGRRNAKKSKTRGRQRPC